MKYPDDANGDALRQLEAAGLDLSVQCEFAFRHAFEDKSDADDFIQEIATKGYRTELTHHQAIGVWLVDVKVSMEPSHAKITALEKEFGDRAWYHEGFPHGWGVGQPVSRRESNCDPNAKEP